MTLTVEEKDAFFAKAIKGIGVAMKMKKSMLSKGLRVARAHCPLCEGGMLSAVLAGRRDHIHIQCSTPGCIALME